MKNIPVPYSHSYFRDNALAFVCYILVFIQGIVLMPLIIKTVGVIKRQWLLAIRPSFGPHAGWPR